MLEPYNKLIFKKKKLFLKLIQWKIGACVVNILAATQLATVFLTPPSLIFTGTFRTLALGWSSIRASDKLGSILPNIVCKRITLTNALAYYKSVQKNVVKIDNATLSITTFSIMALSITTFSIMKLSIKGLFATLSITFCHYAECCILYFVMQKVAMLNVIMLNVTILSDLAPKNLQNALKLKLDYPSPQKKLLRTQSGRTT
jgi:hypothetical protein